MRAQNDERRAQSEDRCAVIARRIFGVFVLGFAFCALRFFASCAEKKPSTTQPSTMEERQEAAMKDPMNYKPQFGNGDISGGDIGHFDRDGLKKDWNDVLNP